MPIYLFKARDRRGAAVAGQLEADNLLLARRILSQQDLIPISVKERNALSDMLLLPSKLRDQFFPVAFEELLTFNQQLQTAYSVGIPMVQAMEMIEAQTSHPRMKRALSVAADDVRKGKYLADAFQKHPAVFDRIYITLVRAGEASGELDAFLERISYLLERRADNKMKIKSALFYPKLVFGFLVIVVGIFVYLIVPKIKEFFQANGADLPLITRALIAVSDFAVYNAPLLILGGLSLFGAIRYILSTPTGRMKWDGFKLKLPVLGDLFLQLELNMVCFITETLVKSGITITETLKILRNTLENQVIAVEMETCRLEVERGGKFSKGLSKSRVFPELFVNLIAMGEEAGRLEPVLSKVGNHYRREIDYKLSNLSKLLEPLILLILFFLSGFLALAVYLPIWQMASVVR